MKRAAIAWLIVVAGAGALLIFQLHRGVALQTDLTALLVQQKGDAVMRRAVDLATARLSQRIFVLAGDYNREAAREAGASLAESLRRSGLALAITYRLPPDSLTALGSMYFPYRFGLLTA